MLVIIRRPLLRIVFLYTAYLSFHLQHGISLASVNLDLNYLYYNLKIVEILYHVSHDTQYEKPEVNRVIIHHLNLGDWQGYTILL